jgi:hypothetical protein
MINYSELDGLNRLDICVGGDHGGREFRMSLKLLFRFNENKTISCFYQIASVLHPQDDSQLLNDTVLGPIGESLRIIIDKSRFIVQLDNSSSTLAVNFNLMASISVFFFFFTIYFLRCYLSNIFLSQQLFRFRIFQMKYL